VLASTLFPVGHMEKEDVRKLAKRFNLPVAEKKDSQGVCFLGSVSVKEFLERELGNGNPALFYTIGQRVSLDDLPSGVSGGAAWYVVEKNIETKEIKVAKTRAEGAREIRFTDANWHGDPVEVTSAQVRYRGERCAGCVQDSRFVGEVPLPDTPAPGQSIVFYKNNELVGGGIITA
jgi:tRNA-specific 2-thiouridylase